MIKYEGLAKMYNYEMKDLNDILKTIEKFHDAYNTVCTQENISKIVENVNQFLSNVKTTEEKTILERHETEEEAREYFGKDFVSRFEELLTVLAKQHTDIALHGTSYGRCRNICEEGLKYKTNTLDSTAVIQSLYLENGKIYYKNYEKLLNWTHKNYKNLVIISLPYECHYKEGLWKPPAEPGDRYRIDPDFIVGYIDVNNKELVINDKYKREHNYDGYVPDNHLFNKNELINNEQFAELQKEQTSFIKEQGNIDYDCDLTLEMKAEASAESLEHIFRELKYVCPNSTMNEKQYNYLLSGVSEAFGVINNIISKLPTKEQLKSNNISTVFDNEQNLDDDETLLSNPNDYNLYGLSDKNSEVETDFVFGSEWTLDDELDSFSLSTEGIGRKK